MRNLWAILCFILLSTVGDAQGPQLPATGRVSGHITGFNGETVTLSGLVANKPATRTYSIAPTVRVELVPEPNVGLSTVLVPYGDVARGAALKAASWLANRNSIVDMPAEIDAKDGVVTGARLFPSCTRERCWSSTCGRMCKSSSCSCPTS